MVYQVWYINNELKMSFARIFNMVSLVIPLDSDAHRSCIPCYLKTLIEFCGQLLSPFIATDALNNMEVTATNLSQLRNLVIALFDGMASHSPYFIAFCLFLFCSVMLCLKLIWTLNISSTFFPPFPTINCFLQ